jgi:signal transduction histidine kinase
MALVAHQVSPELWDAFQRGATAAWTQWERGVGDSLPAEEVEGHVASICDAIRQAIRGEEPQFRDLSPQVPMRRLLESIRRNFLDQVQGLSGFTDTEAVIRVLRAIEEAQGALDRDCAQRFVNRLSGADALDLIVEVSHDMRSPLASILFLVETLRKGNSGPISGIQERQLGLVYSAAFGLSSLASDVIELARGRDRLVDLHPVPFSVAETFQSVRDIVEPMAEEKGLLVRTNPPASDFRVGHPAGLNRVLLNLTTNALKFTSTGFVEVTGKQLSRTRVEFSVRDTGRGIPPQVMSTLFDAFRRRQKPGEYTFSSAGLGLSICRKLVEVMGGELHVETASEAGTRFYFELDLPLASKM